MARFLTHVLIIFVALEVSTTAAYASQDSRPTLEAPSNTVPDIAPGVQAVNAPAISDAPASITENAPTKDVAYAQLQSAPLTKFSQRSGDEVWAISSRHVDSIHCPTSSLQFKQRLGHGRWQRETSTSFFACDPSAPQHRTVIYVHGNRTTEPEAIREGLQTYDQTILKRNDTSPVRFIIWMWSSDRVCGQIRDVRIKAERADEHAFHLARLLTQLPNTNVGIIGFSFGGRLTLGAMHLVGGGCIDGYRLRERHQLQATFDLSLVAPAIRYDCFVTTHDMALRHTERLLLLYNTQDQYLKLYRFFGFDTFNPALGSTGICGVYCADRDRAVIKQHDASQRVGREHDYLKYLVDKRIEQWIRDNLFDPTQ